MRVLLFGATGLLGRSIALRLARDGHKVKAWVRSPAKAVGQLEADVELIPASSDSAQLLAAVKGVDAIINVAGEPVAKRWTASTRARLHRSRVGLAQAIASAVSQCDRPPKVWVQASAVGYYGDRGDEQLDEGSAPGDGFLADLCQQWESRPELVDGRGTRVVRLRLGVVLATDGGALPALARPARLGLGAVIGHGSQYMPWIHLEDAVELFVTALDDPRYQGVINAVAPHQVRHREFVDCVSRVLKRPRFLRVPGLFLRLILGDAAQIVLASQKVAPRRALELGFAFRFDDLEQALLNLLRPPSNVVITRATGWPEDPYFRAAPPRWKLESLVELAAPKSQVVPFFSRPQNLGAMTPAKMAFGSTGDVSAPVETGSIIEHRLRVAGFPLRWRSKICSFDINRGFVDCQLRGPYRVWYHEHEFVEQGGRTIMIDRVWYSPPLGWLGDVAQRLFLERTLREIFSHRTRCAQLRFGVGREGVREVRLAN